MTWLGWLGAGLAAWVAVAFAVAVVIGRSIRLADVRDRKPPAVEARRRDHLRAVS